MEQKALSQAEMLTGLEFERLILLAQIRARTLIEAQAVFVAHLRRVHDCDEDWNLSDWAQGFTRQVNKQAEKAEEVGNGN